MFTLVVYICYLKRGGGGGGGGRDWRESERGGARARAALTARLRAKLRPREWKETREKGAREEK